jgi:outer membrane protein
MRLCKQRAPDLQAVHSGLLHGLTAAGHERRLAAMLRHMQKTPGLALCAALSLLGSTAQAQTISTDTIAPDSAHQPKWEAGVAGVAVTVPDYPASDQNRTIALPAPYFVYHGSTFRSDDEGSRLRQILTPNVELSLSGGGALSSDSKHSDARSGMPDLGYLLEVGPNVRLTYDGPMPETKWVIDLPIRAVASLNDFDLRWRGLIFAPEFAYQSKHFVNDHLNLRIALGAEVGTRLLQRYFYEVPSAYATADRAAYSASAGYLGSSLAATLNYKVTKKLKSFVSLEYDNYAGAANNDSPLYRSNDGYAAVIGFSWSFLQSHEIEED